MGLGVNGDQPGEFVAAWRHVHDIFTSVGATNATWVWCPYTVIASDFEGRAVLRGAGLLYLTRIEDAAEAGDADLPLLAAPLQSDFETFGALEEGVDPPALVADRSAVDLPALARGEPVP